jgi:hypothetical protein
MTHVEKKNYKYISNLENDICYAPQLYLLYTWIHIQYDVWEQSNA